MDVDDGTAHRKPPKGPWYAHGLRFECRPDCGRCCTRHDGYSYVYLDRKDVARLAAHFDMTPTEFRARWTERDDGHTILRMDEAACPFLEGSRCAVYGARPSQCATFPFWSENLRTRARWESLGSFCPGIGSGEIVPLHVIRDSIATKGEY